MLIETKNYLKHILFKFPFKLQWHRNFFSPEKGTGGTGDYRNPASPISPHETAFPGSALKVKNTMCDPDNMSSIKDLV